MLSVFTVVLAILGNSYLVGKELVLLFIPGVAFLSRLVSALHCINSWSLYSFLKTLPYSTTMLSLCSFKLATTLTHVMNQNCNSSTPAPFIFRCSD